MTNPIDNFKSKNLQPKSLQAVTYGCRFNPSQRHTATAKGLRPPLFGFTPCRITTGPDSKAAMNRPKRFRGLATDPGVQRKAPRTVIQRENKPKGPRLEEQSNQVGD
ncbi:hypothetical protein [Pseudomonas poae]|uniref:hypothetical protein n=1 Tax=Pseudomonas poae TaxID=200451 RepID=UPI00114CD5A1|nr:hypothetical protein [Pseudomonas poae]